MTPDKPDILTADEAAELLRLNPEVLRRKAAKGEIPGKKVGGTTWRFSRRELMKQVEQDAAKSA
jgi:excisionase family DNA binding protein